MRKGLTLLLCLVIQAMAAVPHVLWQKEWNSGKTDKLHDIGVDPEGYLYYTGESREEVVLLVVGKMTTDGDTVWRRTYSQGYDAIGYGLVVLPNHHLAVVGTEAASGDPRSFSLRYSSEGDLIKTAPTVGRAIDVPPVVVARHEDSCYVGASGTNSMGATRTSYYLLDSLGEIEKTYSYTAGGEPFAGMVIDTFGSIYIARPPCRLGKMTYDMEGQGFEDYEGNPGEMLNAQGLAISFVDEIYCTGKLLDNSTEDFFLLKWDTLKAPIWGEGGHKRYDLGADECCEDIALDSIADCYLAGWQARGEEEDIALVKTDSAGRMLWSWVDTLEGRQQIEGIEVDPDGYIYLAGSRHNDENWDMLVMKVAQPLSITGRVTDSTGAAMEGIPVALTGDTLVEVLTDTGGYYFIEVYNGDSYTVSPDLPGWTFEPSSHTYSPLAHREFEQNFENGRRTGIAEESTEPSASWEPATSFGSQIVLKYSSYPQGSACFVVFDAAGQKVDEIHASAGASSGTITWGEDYSPGVYFIREMSDSLSATQKVILIR